MAETRLGIRELRRYAMESMDGEPLGRAKIATRRLRAIVRDAGRDLGHASVTTAGTAAAGVPTVLV